MVCDPLVIMKLFNLIKPRRIKLPGFQGSVGCLVKSDLLPPDYKLETDGEKFRFVDIGSGFKSDAYGTPAYAAKLAWHVYNTSEERRLRVNWKDL